MSATSKKPLPFLPSLSVAHLLSTKDLQSGSQLPNCSLRVLEIKCRDSPSCMLLCLCNSLIIWHKVAVTVALWLVTILRW